MATNNGAAAQQADNTTEITAEADVDISYVAAVFDDARAAKEGEDSGV